MTPIRLTSLAHGGGCGCKIAPSILQKMLANQPEFGPFEHLLVGTETSDDAAVYELDNNTCIIATTDFFMPMVDDPATFGRIAAANAISDIYAMGGKPIMALAILGMPVEKIAPDIVAQILHGGREMAAEAGIPVAGGHSIDCPEPVYGLAVIGIVDKKHLRRNADAKTNDALLLLKPLGVGIYSAAFKKSALAEQDYRDMVMSMTQLNSIGTSLAQDDAVHALTDVTGFGILGHALEMAKGTNKALELSYAALPFLPTAQTLAKDGFITGASKRNWASYGDDIQLPDTFCEYQRHLLCDPQTSGGLLVAVAPEAAERIKKQAIAAGYGHTSIIGHVKEGHPKVYVHF